MRIGHLFPWMGLHNPRTPDRVTDKSHYRPCIKKRKISQETVRKIKILAGMGLSMSDIALVYPIQKEYIRKIVHYGIRDDERERGFRFADFHPCNLIRNLGSTDFSHRLSVPLESLDIYLNLEAVKDYIDSRVEDESDKIRNIIKAHSLPDRVEKDLVWFRTRPEWTMKLEKYLIWKYHDGSFPIIISEWVNATLKK